MKKMGAGKDEKEEFDMKQLTDVKDMLMKKIGLKKEEFAPFDEDESKDPWCDKQGSPIN